jgi:hypothetical protein
MLVAGVPLHIVSQQSPPTTRSAVQRLSAAMGWRERVPLLPPLLHRCYTAAKRPPRILSETASDLLFSVGMTGFEPAAP